MSKNHNYLSSKKNKDFKTINNKGEIALKRITLIEEKLQKNEVYEETQSLIDSLYSSFVTLKTHFDISEATLKKLLPLFYNKYISNFNKKIINYRNNNHNKNSVTCTTKRKSTCYN